MITIPVTGYAIVLACSINAGTPDCIEQLATGYVWANAQRCQEELDRAKIPGAQCESLSGITVSDEGTGPALARMIDVEGM